MEYVDKIKTDLKISDVTCPLSCWVRTDDQSGIIRTFGGKEITSSIYVEDGMVLVDLVYADIDGEVVEDRDGGYDVLTHHKDKVDFYDGTCVTWTQEEEDKNFLKIQKEIENNEEDIKQRIEFVKEFYPDSKKFSIFDIFYIEDKEEFY